MRLAVFSVVALAFAACAVRAETPPPLAGDGGRFSMTPAENGFLRLDRETGAVSFCAVQGGAAVCRAGADERLALTGEVERLRQENADLKARLAGPPQSTLPRSAVPGEVEMERALGFTERFLRRILRIFREEAPRGDTL